jgi:phosphoribosylanthranilate isomerase
MKIKICGITTLDDALACARAGADLLGFNFYPPSPRYIDPVDCATIIPALRREAPHILTVGIFVNELPESVKGILERYDLDLAQCSGDETPGMLLMTGAKAFKALRLKGMNDIRTAMGIFPARPFPPAFLIDASRPGEYGGTGQIANWDLAAVMAARCSILLAGGLDPENVAEAIRRVRPWGIDVASGVESTPGRKDIARVMRLIQLAHTAAEGG